MTITLNANVEYLTEFLAYAHLNSSARESRLAIVIAKLDGCLTLNKAMESNQALWNL